MENSKLIKIFGPIVSLIVGFICPLILYKNNAICVLNSYFFEELRVFSILLSFSIVLISISLIFLDSKHGIGVGISILSIILLFIFIVTYNSDSLSRGLIVYGIYCLMVLMTSITKFNKELSFTIKDIVEIGVFIALAIVLDLSFFKIRLGQNGGSISLVMVPLFILCLRKGFVKGFVACGIVYGLINCMFDGYGFMTYPLDYLLAFGSLAIIGLFRKQILNKGNRLKVKGIIFLILGAIISIIFRTIFATISGIVFYGLDFFASLIYQLTYLLPSTGAVIVLLLILYKPLLLIEKVFKNK